MGNATSFKPGQSGNARGRKPVTKALSELIRKATGEGQEIVDFHRKVLSGELSASVVELGVRAASAEWLRRNGWGNAPDEISDDGAEDEREQQIAQLLRLPIDDE